MPDERNFEGGITGYFGDQGHYALDRPEDAQRGDNRSVPQRTQVQGPLRRWEPDPLRDLAPSAWYNLRRDPSASKALQIYTAHSRVRPTIGANSAGQRWYIPKIPHLFVARLVNQLHMLFCVRLILHGTSLQPGCRSVQVGGNLHPDR